MVRLSCASRGTSTRGASAHATVAASTSSLDRRRSSATNATERIVDAPKRSDSSRVQPARGARSPIAPERASVFNRLHRASASRCSSMAESSTWRRDDICATKERSTRQVAAIERLSRRFKPASTSNGAPFRPLKRRCLTCASDASAVASSCERRRAAATLHAWSWRSGRRASTFSSSSSSRSSESAPNANVTDAPSRSVDTACRIFLAVHGTPFIE